MGKLTRFLRKGSEKDYIIVKIVFFFSYFKPTLKTEIFLFFLIVCISSIPNFCKSFAFGRV